MEIKKLDHEVIELWPEGAPGSQGWGQLEQEAVLPPPANLKVVRNVTQPTLTAFLPEASRANGTTVIVCPGGAWHFLAVEHEGTAVADWLNQQGITAFMLKYRLLRTGENFLAELGENLQDRGKMQRLMGPLRPMLLADGQQAVRMVRQRAAEWGLKPERIGMMGFSAGAHVTANVAFQYEADCRPDFAAPIYSAPVEDMPVPADAPPLFLLCAADDEMASASSLDLYSKWKAAGRPVELHIYAQGGHGFGMNRQGLPSDSWIERFTDWLRSQGYL